MKILFRVFLLLLIVAGSFLVGSWATFQGGRNQTTAERKILHYVDPMNPALKSDKPGIAPCGMPLEPVYADQSAPGGAGLQATMPPGTIRIIPEKQQLIGVKVATVEKAPWTHTVRVLGRVAPDETLTYRINAAVNCSIENVLPVTTGSLVKKNELLATYYAPEYRTTLLVYYNLIKTGGTASSVGGATDVDARASKELRARRFENYGQTGRADTGLQNEYYRQLLINYGFSEVQLAEMERTLTIPEAIEVRAPVNGFILSRNISAGLRVDRGAEFFRIADLSRVWVLADLFETEATYFKPGMRVKMELPYQKKTLYAQVSPVLPQFDPATRTLKVRLVADNPGYVMRPDMFVNVELSMESTPAIIVPVDAVLDSGLKKTVFVDRGNGFFEPRQVETGRLLGDRVEITRGVIPGEKIVVSGNFLIDSEARMQQAASGITGKIGRDPVCGMNIDEDRARAEGNFLEYKGRTYFFCDSSDRDTFRKDPERYLKSSPPPKGMSMNDSPDGGTEHHAHGATEAPKPHSAKTASEAHNGMTMPVANPPAAMPGMPAASAETQSRANAMAMPKTPAVPAKTESEAKEMAMPPPAPSGMGHPQPPYPPGMLPPGETVPSLPPQQENLPGLPQGGATGPPGAAPIMPEGKTGVTLPPAVATPGVGPGAPIPPGQGNVRTPGRSQQAAPMPRVQTGEITGPQPPATRTLRVNSRGQQYLDRPPRIPPQIASPIPGSKGANAPAIGMGQGLPPQLPPPTSPQLRLQEAAPALGTKAGEGPSLPQPTAP